MTVLAERPAETFPTNQAAPALRGGSYVTAGGAPVVPANTVEGSYLTLPAAA